MLDEKNNILPDHHNNDSSINACISSPMGGVYGKYAESCVDVEDSCGNDSFDRSTNKSSNLTETESIPKKPVIFRFKFSQEFTDELFKFSKIHEYDHRKDFKEAWEKWVDDNKELVDNEISRLTELHYQGDIMDKMFKSARYYFRKKGIGKKEPAERGFYVSLNKDILILMDEQIKDVLKRGDHKKPSDYFEEFCRLNSEIIKEKTGNLLSDEGFDEEMVENKIKKTYKNRYFTISKSNI